MKRVMHILNYFAVLTIMVACSKPVKVEVPELVEGPTIALSQIDTLLWHQPDSALAVMMEFAASPEADSLDVFEGHYCQVLVAELLFKNDYGQSNRGEVLKAVHYFDSIVGIDGADARDKADCIEGFWLFGFFGWLPFVEYYAVLIGQPSAGFAKVNVKVAHHKVDGTALSPAHKTMIHILSGAIRQTGVTVGMKRTETLVALYAESKSLGDPLNGQVAKLLQFILIHNH